MPINSHSTDLGLGLVPEGVPSELFGQFSDIYLAIRKLAVNLDRYTGNAALPELGAANVISSGTNTGYFAATAAINARHVVHLNSTGVEHAAADGTKAARGIAMSAVTAGELVAVVLFGPVGIPGVTKGTTYWLHVSDPGKLQTTPPTTGQWSQPIGFAIDTDRLFVNPHLVMELVP